MSKAGVAERRPCGRGQGGIMGGGGGTPTRESYLSLPKLFLRVATPDR